MWTSSGGYYSLYYIIQNIQEIEQILSIQFDELWCIYTLRTTTRKTYSTLSTLLFSGTSWWPLLVHMLIQKQSLFDLYHQWLVLPAFKLHINGIKQYVLLLCWASFSQYFACEINLCSYNYNNNLSFVFLCIIPLCTYTIFTNSPTVRHLFCLQFGAIVNKDMMNFLLHVCWFSCIHMLSFSRYHWRIFKAVVTIYTPTGSRSFSCSVPSLTNHIIGPLDLGASGRVIVVSHCSFTFALAWGLMMLSTFSHANWLFLYCLQVFFPFYL